MASPGNGIESWAPRQGGRAGELLKPVASPENGNHLSAAKPISSEDHLLHLLPARADSAYSSFSGGSNAPDYPTPSCCGESCCLPPEQAPYMDSEYVRGIYQLTAANPDLRCQQPAKAADPSTHSTGLGCSSTRGTPQQLPLVAPPPAPPTRLDSYKVTRHLENSRGRGSSGSHSKGSGQDNQLADGDAPRSQGRDGEPAGGKTLENRGFPSDSANEVAVSKSQGLKMEENGEWSPAQQVMKRSNPQVFSRPSSFIFQEYLKADSGPNAPRMLSVYHSVQAHKIPGEMISKSYHPVHTNPKPVNDTQEDKQPLCRVRQPASRAADLGPEPSPAPGSLPCAPCTPLAELYSDLDQDVFEDTCVFKQVEGAPGIPSAARKLKSCTAENACCDSGGKAGSDVREALLRQQGKRQRPPLPCSYHAVETAQEELGQGNKQCSDDDNQMSLLRPKEDCTSPSLHEVKREKQANTSRTDISTCLGQEEPPVPYQKYQPKLPNQPLRQLQDDLAGEQISWQTTPMLYYLSGGQSTNLLQHHKLSQHQEDPRSSPKELPAGSSTSARCPEVQRDSDQLQSTNHHQYSAADLLQAEHLIPGSPASSMEESFKHDYRERLKVAQKKVLRETSFKRKDLQMSLPVRLRQKASQRPSIEHLRSFSLSSASEDAKPVPPSPSHLGSMERLGRDEEVRKPQTGRAGGRRRVTKEQKKLCYSEPERLDQLADKEVPWSQGRDGIPEQDTVAARRKALESRGRALSSSSISRVELKQIQHTALIEYMERKINQRPNSSQHLPQQKPPLQKRLSHPRWPPGKLSNPHGSSKVQNNEVFCQVFSKDKSAGVFPPLAFVPPLSGSSRSDASYAAAAISRHDLYPNGPDGTCFSKGASAESLLQAGGPAAGRAPERAKSPPPSTQDTCGSAGGPVAPSGPCESCLNTPSFHDPEKDGCESHEHKASDLAGCAGSQDTKDLAPEASIPAPRRGSKDDAQLGEEEGRAEALKDNALTEQQPAAQQQGTSCQAAFAHQGEQTPAKGLVAKESSLHKRQDDVLHEGAETHLPRRVQSAEDQRYEELAMELLAKDNSLVDVLMPHPVGRAALDLMEGLFPGNISMLEKSQRRKGDVQHLQGSGSRRSSRGATEECPESEHEAKQRSKDPALKGNQALAGSRDSTNDPDDITSKKLELISTLQAKLQRLCEERELLLAECRECGARGERLEATVRALCKPNESQRYLMFIGDLEKVVSLLLCLSSRLARVQNAIRRIDGNTDAEEKQSLRERHQLLSRQREDAKDLKENLDRRERVVSGILAKYLTEQQLQDYRAFVQLKTCLLVEQKDLEEQIKFFEEQLENLQHSIPL